MRYTDDNRRYKLYRKGNLKMALLTFGTAVAISGGLAGCSATMPDTVPEGYLFYGSCVTNAVRTDNEYTIYISDKDGDRIKHFTKDELDEKHLPIGEKSYVNEAGTDIGITPIGNVENPKGTLQFGSYAVLGSGAAIAYNVLTDKYKTR